MSYTKNALRWLETILYERFGQSFGLVQQEVGVELSLLGYKGKITFDQQQSVFCQSRSDFPSEQWLASVEGFRGPIKDALPAPSEHKLTSPLIEFHEQGAIIHYDILGLTYWMLTRLEEIGRTDLDEHQRFPAISSHAFKYGYLERPIVDEWLNVLGQVARIVWPEIELKSHHFSMKVSHDVDSPARYAFHNLKGLVRTMGGDVLIRKDIAAAFKAPLVWLNSRHAIHPNDPANTFDWLMEQSECNGLTSAFYFICGRTDTNKDARYDPEMPHIRKLMREIHQRGHEIGLHPSYNTCKSPELIKREADRLHSVCQGEGITQSKWGGRMHYLRWEQEFTVKALGDAGLDYDSTLGYADRAGFRCGTCHEYLAFDVIGDQVLDIRIRPLVAMDCTVISDRYMGFGSTEKAYEKFCELKESCRKVGGVFTLLWHNSFFSRDMNFEIYRRLVSEQ